LIFDLEKKVGFTSFTSSFPKKLEFRPLVRNDLFGHFESYLDDQKLGCNMEVVTYTISQTVWEFLIPISKWGHGARRTP
jgi:hypothetical protein